MIAALTVAMVGAALYLWRRTGRASAAIVVVAVFFIAALVTGLITL